MYLCSSGTSSTPLTCRIGTRKSGPVTLLYYLSFPNLSCTKTKLLNVVHWQPHSLPPPTSYSNTRVLVTTNTAHIPFFIRTTPSLHVETMSFYTLPNVFPGQSLVVVKILFRCFFYQESFPSILCPIQSELCIPSFTLANDLGVISLLSM